VTASSVLASGQTAASNSADSQIRAVLQAQTEAWNRGDLEGYMDGYWKSPELTFFSNATETEGWQPTLDRYKKRYQGEGHSMGKVDFPELQVTLLSADAAFVRGQWHLTMPDGKEPHGMFTLIVKRFPEGWRIVHDHSSGE
jgi:beta-aspartyl-peptidase (threonine type)